MKFHDQKVAKMKLDFVHVANMNLADFILEMCQFSPILLVKWLNREKRRTIQMSYTKESHEELLKEIHNRLAKCSEEELEHVQHVLSSLDTKGNGRLHYLARFLGIEWDGEKGTMTLGMQHANTYGVAQGGAIYTLADIAMGYIILDTLPENQTSHTLELKMNYIAPGKGTHLYAYPEVIHHGRQTAVVQCRIENEDKKLIAQGLGTFFIKHH